jgi:hypothetical protein
MTDDLMFKPGYDGARPPVAMTGPEKQAFRAGRAALVRRLHDAILTLAALGGQADLGVQIGGTPSHIVEFGDRVGEEAVEAPPARFKPTAPQVSDMDRALALLEGLRKPYFKVLLFRALHEFGRENGEQGDWPWPKIGGYFGLSGAWAESVYDATLVQAARRSGLLPPAPVDYAVVAAAAWVNHMWLTNIGTAADPRQAVANIRQKSPVRIEEAFCLWVAGAPLARRIVDATKPLIRNANDHGSWYRIHPDVLADHLTEKAREIGAAWQLEDIATNGKVAA